jgi:hypothetical protein
MHIHYGIYLLLVILVIYLATCDSRDYFVDRRDICNVIDGRCYNVVEDFQSPEQASETLAQLNQFSIRFMKHVRRKYLWNKHPNEEAKFIIKFLLSNYNPDGIIENAPKNNVNTSYVDDKGREFGICLREKISGHNRFHQMHDLEFVVLHELSHMANINFGHERDFWEIFKFLLKEAKEAGLHEPVDYSKTPINYCSLMVYHNPYFDKTIRDI